MNKKRYFIFVDQPSPVTVIYVIHFDTVWAKLLLNHEIVRSSYSKTIIENFVSCGGMRELPAYEMALIL